MAAKKYEEMDDHELMLEMVKMQKKDAMGQKLTAYATIAIFVAVLIALLMIVPRVIILLDDISKTVKNADTAVSQVQNSISELDAAMQAARNEIHYIGTFSNGHNLMGKILKMCQMALLDEAEPPINYDLLRSKNIYLFGELLTFGKN